MKKRKFPQPKQFWIYLSITVIIFVMLFANIFLMVGSTDDKEFWRFTKIDWLYLVAFLSVEILLVFLMFVFSQKTAKVYKNQSEQYYSQFKYSGIKPGDYDYIWFDFSGCMRALVLASNNVYKVYVDDFDEKTGNWVSLGMVGCYDSLSELKTALYYDCDFFFEGNAELDKHGDEVFKES